MPRPHTQLRPRPQTNPEAALGARWIRPGAQMREMFEGGRIMRIESGEHRVVSARRGAPAGALVARQVLLLGGQAHCSGLMEVVMYGGFLDAGYKVIAQCWGGRVEARTAEVMLFGGEAIGRETSTIYVASNEAVVEAFDDTIVVINPGFKPRVELHDRAQIVRRRH